MQSDFSALTIGASFDRAKHGEAMKLFKPKAHGQTSSGNIAGSGSSAEPGASRPAGVRGDGTSTFTLAAPAADLSLFGSSLFDEAHDHRGDGGEKNGANSASSGGKGEEDAAAAKGHPPLKPMTYKKMKNIWRKHELQVEAADAPAPISHFSDLVRPPLSVPENVVNNLFERQHRVPTPIQIEAIPSLIKRRDVLACAPTGSGKTLAFLIPLFALLKKPDPTCGVRALVMTPTMELAMQIEREAFFLMRGQRWRLVQHGQSTKNKDIFVTTPGRLMTMLEQDLIKLDAVEYLVFDEGDRLWDTSTDFLKIVDRVLAACTNPNKVVSLFSATLSEKVEAAARSVMGPDPVRIIVRGRAMANKNVEQRLVFCGSEMGKIVAMRNLVADGLTAPVLIFVQSIDRSKELFDEIRSKGLHLGMINATMSSEEREQVVLNYRLGKIWILITTELLARGIDFKNVHTVINFDLPTTVESYIHRVGRTGRSGKRGLAITFFTEEDKLRLPQIAKVIKDSGNPIEDWMLEIEVNRRTRRSLTHSTPHRKIVNTKKRIQVAAKRTRQRYDAMEKEAAKAKEQEKLKKNKNKSKNNTESGGGSGSNGEPAGKKRNRSQSSSGGGAGKESGSSKPAKRRAVESKKKSSPKQTKKSMK